MSEQKQLVEWETVKVRVKDLVPHVKNPKKWRKGGQEELDASLIKFGVAGGFRCNADLTLLDGHGRCEELVRMGYGECEISVSRAPWQLSEEEQAEALIRFGVHNRVFDFGELSGDLFKDLDLEEIGLKVEELPTFKKPKVLEAEEDDGPGALPDAGVTVRGDVWELVSVEKGLRHRVMCGSCTDSNSVSLLLGEELPEAIVTDPPYCSGGFQEAQRSSGSIGSGAKEKWGGKRPEIANDKLSTRGWAVLLKSAFALSQSHALYCFTDWRMWVHLFDLAESSGFQVKSMIIWDKKTPGMGMGWRAQHELVLYGTRTQVKFNNKLAVGNVVTCSRSGNPDHPTQKPVELIGVILKASDWANLIYDPFSGSGTTLIACEQLSRHCRGMELDEKYCDVIVRRWLTYMEKEGLEYEVLLNGSPAPERVAQLLEQK